MADNKYPTVIAFENETTKEMDKFHVTETDDTWVIDVEVLEGEPARNWSFLKAALSVIFPHHRDDFPALADFIQAAWVLAKPPRESMAITKPDEQTIKIGQIAHKFSKLLIGTLDIKDPATFANLAKVIGPYTVLYADQQAAKDAEKEAKKAARKALVSAESEAKKAKKKAERDEAKAQKKAEKDAEKLAAKQAKDAEKAKNKTDRQKDMQDKIDAAKAAVLAKAGTVTPEGNAPTEKPLKGKAKEKAEKAAKAANGAAADPHPGGDWTTPPQPVSIAEDEQVSAADAILSENP